MLELYETLFDVKYLQAAIEVQNDMIDLFWDDKSGGFFFTPDDGEKLLVRQKEVYDGAIPSGNSMAMLNLLRLGRMTANSDWEQKAAATMRAFSHQAGQVPGAHTFFMIGVDFGLGPTYEVVIAGKTKGADTQAMIKSLRSRFIPNKVVLLRPTEQPNPAITKLAKFTEYQLSRNNRPTAYVCINYSCKEPTNDSETMLNLLKQK